MAWQTRWTAGLMTVICLGAWANAAWADVAHFHNGKTITGKVSRVTGELVDFKRNWASHEKIPRIRLTDRQDVVQTIDQTYFGEILYIDKFKVEMKTSGGLVKLNRLLVRNIVLGSPVDKPADGFTALPPQPAVSKAGPQPAQSDFKPVANTRLLPEKPTPRLEKQVVSPDSAEFEAGF